MFKKIIFISLFIFIQYVLSSQGVRNNFLTPEKDTIGFINCSNEDLTTLIFNLSQNPNIILAKKIRCFSKISFLAENEKKIIFESGKCVIKLEDSVGINLNKVYPGVVKYYEEESMKLVGKLIYIFIPERENKKYYKTYFTLSIDFTRGEGGKDVYKELNRDSLNNNKLTKLTILKQNNFQKLGMKNLKEKKYNLALIYLRQDYFAKKDPESALTLGNLWVTIGDSSAACNHWKVAADLGNESANILIKSCK